MKKDLGVKPYTFPMPVLMIATYGADGTVDVMNMAWGGVCAENMVALNIDEDHKTAENIKARGAFTLSIADIPHIKEADFFGIATGNKMPDKFARSGLHAVRSEKVDAPVVEEFTRKPCWMRRAGWCPPASTPLSSTSSRRATTPSARRWARPGTPARSWQNKISCTRRHPFRGMPPGFLGLPPQRRPLPACFSP